MTKYQHRLDYAMRIAQHKIVEKNKNQKNVDKIAFDTQYWHIVAEVLYTETVRECADFVRESYDHAGAEGIAWYMEIKYGLHGDYA